MQSDKESLQAEQAHNEERLQELKDALQESCASSETLSLQSSQQIEGLVDEMKAFKEASSTAQKQLVEDRNELQMQLETTVDRYEDKLRSLGDLHARQMQDLNGRFIQSERQLMEELQSAQIDSDGADTTMRSLQEDLRAANETISQLQGNVAGAHD